MEQETATEYTVGGRKIIVTRRFAGEERLSDLLAALAYEAAEQEAEGGKAWTED